MIKEHTRLTNDIEQLIKRYVIVPKSSVYECYRLYKSEQIDLSIRSLLNQGIIYQVKLKINPSSNQKSICYCIRNSGINDKSTQTINGNSLWGVKQTLVLIANLKRFYPSLIHNPSYFPLTAKVTVVTEAKEEKNIEIIYLTPDNKGRVYFHIDNENTNSLIRYVIMDGIFSKADIKELQTKIRNIKCLVKTGRKSDDVDYYSPDEYISEILCKGGETNVSN